MTRLVAWRARAGHSAADDAHRGAETSNRLLRRLAGRRALARLAILFERIWPAVWPALGVAGLVRLRRACSTCRVCCRPGCISALLAVTATADRRAAGARPAAASRAPDDAAADRRLELASGLPHRPLAVLTDRPARGGTDPMGVGCAVAGALSRAIRQVRRLRVGTAASWPGPARPLRAARRAGGGPDRRVRASPARTRLRGWPRRWNRRCRATRRRPRPSFRPGSRRRPTRGWRRCSSSRRVAQCRCRPDPT